VFPIVSQNNGFNLDFWSSSVCTKPYSPELLTELAEPVNMHQRVRAENILLGPFRAEIIVLWLVKAKTRLVWST
jgi:hypothetical protein